MGRALFANKRHLIFVICGQLVRGKNLNNHSSIAGLCKYADKLIKNMLQI